MYSKAMGKLRFHKAFRMLSLSFFVIIIVSLAFAFFSYNRLLDSEMERVEEQARAGLSQAVYSIENYYDSIRQTMIALSMDDDVNSYIYRTPPLDGGDYYRMIQAQKEINMGNLHNAYIYEMGVYVDAIDMVVYSSSCRSSEDFYNTFVDYEGTTAEEWRERLTEVEAFRMKPARYARAAGKWVFEFKLLMPVGSNLGAVIAYMDVSQIEEIFSTGGMLDNGVLTITDGDVTLLTLGDEKMSKDIEGWNENKNNETLTVRCDGQEGRVYTLTLGEEAFYDQLAATRTYILKMLLTELAGIVALSLIMIYINYTPLRRLLHKLGVHSDEYVTYEGTEYDHILNAASRMISHNEELNLQLQKQLPVLRRSLIVQIVTTNATIDRETLREYGVAFDGQYFAVAAMYVDAPDEAGAVLRYSAAALIESRYTGKEKIYSAECAQDAILLLVNSSHVQIQELMEEISLLLKKSLSVDVQIGLGHTAQRISDIHISFEQAMEALTYARAWQKKGVVHHEDIPGFDRVDVYTVSDEYELTRHIRAGNTQGVHDVIRRLYANVEKAPVIHSQIMTYGIVTTCLRLLYEWKIPGANVECAVERITKRIAGSETAGALLNEVLRLTEEICQTMASMKSANASTIGEDARKIIEDNYMNADFSLASAAEMMNLSAPYLSHVFKQQSGDTFVNTLNCIRLERACELLKNTDHSASAISKMCGYSDAGYFNRVFKKKYGMTPGQYREAQG